MDRQTKNNEENEDTSQAITMLERPTKKARQESRMRMTERRGPTHAFFSKIIRYSRLPKLISRWPRRVRFLGLSKVVGDVPGGYRRWPNKLNEESRKIRKRE